MSPRIRPATARDLETVAAIHVRAWREAYAGLIPEPAATGLSCAERAAMRRSRLQGTAAGRGIWLGLDAAGVPVSFLACGARRPDGPDAAAEIHVLSVLARARGQGLGRALMASAARFLPAEGFASLGLWVLVPNLRAIAFYRRLGAVPGPTRRFAIGPVMLAETAMLWPDLTALAGSL
ncbi:GNAT family N-acetyltransferase [Elioraea tepidiphila]|uniref:GNAT family N-acetyltransferase n=1 Tax=Elioraea tepidiphila TaxID=457934 RepID=UPI000365BF03|nr:GNAT family N-acetyltransferase [Elioraea tepidiphila]